MADLSTLTIETAVLTNIEAIPGILGNIIRTARDLVYFRSECSDLANRCIGLYQIYEENRSTLNETRSRAKLLECLEQTNLLLEECTKKWTIRHVGWEVLVEGKIPRLQARLEDCQKVFNHDLLINVKSDTTRTRNDISRLLANFGQHQAAAEMSAQCSRQEFQRHSQKLDHIIGLNQRLAAIEDYPDIPRIFVNSPRLDIKNQKPSHGVFGTLDLKAVVLYEVWAFRIGDISLYQHLASMTLVQAMYGILETEHKNFVIMERLSPDESTFSLIESGKSNDYSWVTRLQFAYDVAAILSTFHSSDLIMKAISDTNIFVRADEKQGIRPVVANLHHARKIWAPSDRAELDVRYEAPENTATGSHSKESDVWSLGVFLLEWLTESFPYGYNPSQIMAKTKAQLLNEFHKCQPKQIFHETKGLHMTRAIAILWPCLSKDPKARPTAISISQGLFELLVQEAKQPQLTDVAEPESMTPSISMVIAEALQQKHAVLSSEKERRVASPGCGTISMQDLQAMLGPDAEQYPAALFAKGVAHLWGLIAPQTDKKDSITENSTRVNNARRAIPYLTAAGDQGYDAANEELYQAYKVLAKFYYAKRAPIVFW